MNDVPYDKSKLTSQLQCVRNGWLTQKGAEWVIETRMGLLVAKFISKEAAEAWWFQHTSPNPTKLKHSIDGSDEQCRRKRKKSRIAGKGIGGKGVGSSFKGKDFVNEPFMPYNEEYGMAEWDAR